MKQLAGFFKEGGWGRFLLTGIAAAMFIWLVGLLGLFSALDGLFYDMIFKTANTVSPPGAQVVLVELDPIARDVSGQELAVLVRNIRKHNPRLIAFNSIPFGMQDEEILKLADGRMTVFGIPLENGKQSAWDSWNWAEQKKQLHWRIGFFKNNGLDAGVYGLPAVSAGVSRHHHAGYNLGGDRFTAFEIIVAQRFLDKNARLFQFPDDDYLVNFRGAPGSLPLVSQARALADDLVPQLFEGRCVLIGYGRGTGNPGLYTPTTSGDHPMSFLEFQGHAINTLIIGKRLRPISPVGRLLLFLCLSLFSLPMYQRMFTRMASWITLLMVAGYSGATYLFFLFSGLWLPLGEMLLLQFFVFVISIRSKNMTADRGFQDLLLDLNAKLRERYYPASIYRVDTHWAQVIAMVTQTLSLRRLIFLERVPGDHRVREVESFNCSLEDIDERRRDYHRFPYSDAIAANGPILIPENRPYLHAENREEEQYLVPLSFAGDILGFWAFGIKAGDARTIPDFLLLVRDYAFIIGELLYNRQEVIKKEENDHKLVYQLALEREEEAYRALKQTIAFLKRRFDNLTNLFNGLHVMVIVYDLFGRVLEANREMLDQLKTLGYAPYDMTPADMVAKLTGKPLSEAQQLLRQVVNDRGPVSFLVTLQDRRFNLYLRPLEFDSSSEELPEPAPFGVNGIVCELMETTSMVEIYEMKKYLANKLSGSVIKGLEELEREIDVFAQPLDERKQKRLAVIYRDKINTLIATMNKCHLYVSRGTDLLDYSQILPVNSARSLRQALENVQPAMQKGLVQIETSLPENLPEVYAMPGFLRQLFEYISIVMIKDTRQRGRIVVIAQEEDEWVRFDFSNTNGGFGTPGGKLQQQLFGESESSGSTEIKKLKESVEWIKTWGGLISVDSDLGKGTHFTLHLAMCEPH